MLFDKYRVSGLLVTTRIAGRNMRTPPLPIHPPRVCGRKSADILGVVYAKMTKQFVYYYNPRFQHSYSFQTPNKFAS